MTKTEHLQKEQSDYWNGEMGETWAEAQDFFDTMLRPFEDLLVEEVEQMSPRSVLDVGCGNGSTTLAFKRALPALECTGVDISEPMIENAISRARREQLDAEFILADAATHDFSAEEFDLLASRFGVMFFADPVAAFSHLRKAMTKKAQLRLVVWRSPEENDFMTAAARAVAPLLDDVPAKDPFAPGPFSLSDPDHLASVLEASGWKHPTLVPHDVPCAFSASDLDRFFTRMARVGVDLEAMSAERRAEISEAVRRAYDPYLKGDEVQFIGRCWLVRANA